MIRAVEGHDLALVKDLIGRGADPIISSGHGYSPLHYAACTGDNGEISRALLDGGADLEARTGQGRTPLYIAAKWNPKLVARLIEWGADIEAADSQGSTPLLSAMGSFEEVVELLCRLGANPNVGGDEPALLRAIRWGSIRAVQALLLAGADPHKRLPWGETLLDEAKRRQRHDICELLEKGEANL